MSPRASQSARWTVAALIALIAAALGYLLIGATDSAITVWSKLQTTPQWMQIVFLVLLSGLGLAAGYLIWRILFPGPGRAPVAEPIVRERIEQRAAALPQDDAAVLRVQRELSRSDARRASAQLYVALFGDISAGKSALLGALSGQPAQSHVVGGTTREVAHAHVVLDDGLSLDLADVPGTNEVHGEQWAQVARGEAARAHALVYVCDAEPTRAQDAEIRRIGRFGKPLLLALNKTDRYAQSDLDAVLQRLRERYADLAFAVCPVRAGGVERLKREDGQWVERQRAAQLRPLWDALREIAAHDPQMFEAAREQSVLAHVDAVLDAREIELREERGQQTVRKYTKRAVVGAMLAVAPGTDLIIQGALAISMVRELAAIHGLRVRDVEIDGLIERAGSLVRTTASVTLAIAGNALKAFPGFGTVGGGMVHAVAYGLVFDSLGNAVAQTLAHARSLDRAATLSAFEEQLQRPSRERLRILMELAREAVGERFSPNSSERDA